MRQSDRVPHTGIFPNARTIEHEGGPDAVLLLHGWTGWTGRVAYLGERLRDAGLAVRIPRLPGHGTSLEDFRSCSWRDWQRRAIDEYLDLCDRYETVYLAGTSMGSALSVILAATFPVPKIALLAPAVVVRNPLLFLTPVLQYIVPRIPADWSPDDDPDPEAGPIGREMKSHNYTGSLAQLYHIMMRARRMLPRVRSETLIIASRKDEAVPVRAARMIEDRIGSEVVKSLILEKSGHQMVQGVERETVCDAVVDWFQARR